MTVDELVSLDLSYAPVLAGVDPVLLAARKAADMLTWATATAGRRRRSSALFLEVVLVHHLHELLEVDARLPAERSLALLASPMSMLTSVGRMKRWSCLHERTPVVEAGDPDATVEQLADGVRLARRDHVVVGLVLLEHEPHRRHVVAGVAPVARGVEVAERDLVLQAELDARDRVGDLAGDELEPAARAFVVEEDAATTRACRTPRGS